MGIKKKLEYLMKREGLNASSLADKAKAADSLNDLF